jgi:hypothetical protein
LAGKSHRFNLASYRLGHILGDFSLRPKGDDVMITFFGDFCQFSAKNGVFIKNHGYDQKLAVV